MSQGWDQSSSRPGPSQEREEPGSEGGKVGCCGSLCEMGIEVVAKNETKGTWMAYACEIAESSGRGILWRSNTSILPSRKSTRVGEAILPSSISGGPDMYFSLYFCPHGSGATETEVDRERKEGNPIDNSNFAGMNWIPEGGDERGLKKGSVVLSVKVRLESVCRTKLCYLLTAFPYGSMSPKTFWHADRSHHTFFWTASSGAFRIISHRSGSRRLVISIEEGNDGGGEGEAKERKKDCEKLTDTRADLLSDQGVIMALDIIFENQRKNHALGSAKYSAEALRVFDRPEWSNADGLGVSKPAFYTLPSPRWEWIGNWRVDGGDQDVDEDGWMYASGWKGEWKSRPSFGSFVRRRRWVRTRRVIPMDQANPEGILGATRMVVGTEEGRIRTPIKKDSLTCKITLGTDASVVALTKMAIYADRSASSSTSFSSTSTSSTNIITSPGAINPIFPSCTLSLEEWLTRLRAMTFLAFKMQMLKLCQNHLSGGELDRCHKELAQISPRIKRSINQGRFPFTTSSINHDGGKVSTDHTERTR